MNSDLKLDLPDLKPIKFSGSQTLGLGRLPSIHYGLLSEKIRQTSSKNFHCSVFCAGKRCRYEGAAYWQKEDMPITGIFSTWITENIVTMARPSTAIIEKYKIIKQFREFGIKSLINLEERGEHSCCGVPLEKSGFTYDPQVFMEHKIFYYNFNWKDYGSVPKTVLLDMVKVLSFALGEGKVAIHGHAGLGRAGVLVACYLVYALRCRPTDAVHYVRAKRPDSVQTKSQVESVQGFAQFVVPMFIVFANVIPRDNYKIGLILYLRRQRHLLHGFEARLLKHIPKPVFMFCERLLLLMQDPQQDSDPFQDPNRFFGFFSSRCRLLRLRFASETYIRQSGDRAKTPGRPVANGVGHCAPPSPPNGIGGRHPRQQDGSCWDDSNESLSSPEVIAAPPPQSRSGGAHDHPHFLAEDEECGLEPDLEYANNNATTQSSMHSAPSLADTPGSVDGGVSKSASEEDLFDEDDPLDDMNSEECNAIIDSVLQACPSEQNTPYLNGISKLQKQQQDVFAIKDDKGCSSNSIEEELWKPLSNSKIIESLLADHYAMDEEFTNRLRKYQRSLNNRTEAWDKVLKETDPLILSALMWSWLDQLREPVLNRNDLAVIVIRADKPMEILQKLDNGTRYTTEYLIRVMTQLQPQSPSLRTDLLRRLVASLTHQAMGIQGTPRPVGMDWNKLRHGTAGQLLLFLDKLYDMVLEEAEQKKNGF